MTKNKSSLQAKKKAASLKLRKTAGFWRRVRDSNPRSLSEHDFSRVAPSTTRTTLQYISKHQVSEIPRKKERTDGENNGYLIVKSTHKNESYQRFRSLGYHISLSVSRAGNEVTLFGSKDEVTKLGDIIVLAVPYGAVASILEANDFTGKILVDITNPVDFNTMEGLLVPAGSSATEVIANLAPQAKVIKAFNTNFASSLAGDVLTSVLLASDDTDAKVSLTNALEGSNLRLIDAGSLKRAHELEALGFLQITLAIRDQITWMGGFSLTK